MTTAGDPTTRADAGDGPLARRRRPGVAAHTPSASMRTDASQQAIGGSRHSLGVGTNRPETTGHSGHAGQESPRLWWSPWLFDRGTRGLWWRSWPSLPPVALLSQGRSARRRLSTRTSWPGRAAPRSGQRRRAVRRLSTRTSGRGRPDRLLHRRRRRHRRRVFPPIVPPRHRIPLTSRPSCRPNSEASRSSE